MPAYTDIDDGFFEFELCSKYVFRYKYDWNAGERNDIIVFDESSNMRELNKDLRLGKHVTIEMTNMIKKL